MRAAGAERRSLPALLGGRPIPVDEVPANPLQIVGNPIPWLSDPTGTWHRRPSGLRVLAIPGVRG